MKKENLPTSKLSREDWIALRDVIWPFILEQDPSKVVFPKVPEHLSNHPLVLYLNLYKETGDNKYLDQAGQCLYPSDKPFGWYLPLTK